MENGITPSCRNQYLKSIRLFTDRPKDFEEISTALGKTFPTSLDLEAQGRFALGYYHQKADYRRRSTERKEAAETANV
jgi:CRISPR-associated protein Csd1